MYSCSGSFFVKVSIQEVCSTFAYKLTNLRLIGQIGANAERKRLRCELAFKLLAAAFAVIVVSLLKINF